MEYWIIKLGTIIEICLALFGISAFVVVAMLIYYFVKHTYENEDEVIIWKKWFKGFVVAAFAFYIVTIIIPNKDILIVYGIEEMYDYVDMLRNFLGINS